MEIKIKKFILPFIIAVLFVTAVTGEDYKNKVIPLNGKLITSDDPSQIGTNFQTLQNLRYVEGHVKGIGGMTKINTTAISTYTNVRNGFHFAKAQPSESHVLVQALNASGTLAVIKDNTAIIPATGNMVATDIYALTSVEPGNFSNAAGGDVIFTNGDESLIWGGNEKQIAAFVTSSAAVTYTLTNSNDYTDVLKNTRQTADQVATLAVGGGIDSYTKLMLHLDGTDGSTTITDTSAAPHAMSVVGNAQIDTASKKFGTGSAIFDGTGDVIVSDADSDDFYFGTGDFSVDFWVRFATDTNAMVFVGQNADANNYWQIYKNTNATNKLGIAFVSGGFYMGDYTMTNVWLLVPNQWYHLEFARVGASAGIWIDGVSQALTVGTAFGANDVGNIASTLGVGAHRTATFPLTGQMDEVRISKGIARHSTSFTAPTQAYGNASNTFLIGSTRQIQGFKPYISSSNSVTSTLTCQELQESNWTSLSITDNTASGGVTLWNTGWVTWPYSGNAKPRYINGLALYWTQCSFSAGQVGLYHVTVDAPMQSIQNIWDGSDGIALKFLKYDGTTYKDYTVEVNDDSQSTYADLSSIQPSHAVYAGFLTPQQGLDIKFVAGSENTSVATATNVYLWNNSDWQNVTALYDGTADSTVPMSKGGVISWQGATAGSEAKRAISDETPLYYYKINFTGALDADVKVSEVRGIPYPQPIAPFKYATMFQGRTILLNEKSNKKNKMLYSAFGSPDVYTGSDDSGEIFIGDDSEVTAAATINLVITSALEQLVITKLNETYRLFGDGPSNWELQKISSTVGCPAPKTMRTANIPLDTAGSLGKNIAIWQGSEGIYITDGKTPSPIHEDIKNVFDKRLSTSINRSKIGDSIGFVDQQNLEYHWLWASGTSTTLDKEYVFDLKRWKWYEIVRGTGKQIQSGFLVTDTTGNTYNYGTLDTGYIERLEYGNDFDGGNIVHTMQLGDIPLADSPMFETRAQYMNIAMVAKTTTTNSVTYNHYVDGSATSTAVTISPRSTGKRIANVVSNINSLIGVFHSPKFTMTTNNEAIGFEPLYIGYFYKVEREHLR